MEPPKNYEEGRTQGAEPKGVRVNFTQEEFGFVVDLTRRRREVPVDRVELTYSWMTEDGYTIQEYAHVREYPPDLILSGPGYVIGPGQTTEMRGFPCPACGSLKTSCWGITTAPEYRSFECHNCQAQGGWGIYCSRRPSFVHLGEACDCEPVWPDEVDFEERPPSP